jgi:hypothetical protein
MAIWHRLIRMARPYQPGALGNSRPGASRSSARNEKEGGRERRENGRQREGDGLSWVVMRTGLPSVASRKSPVQGSLDKKDPPCAFRAL